MQGCWGHAGLLVPKIVLQQLNFYILQEKNG